MSARPSSVCHAASPSSDAELAISDAELAIWAPAVRLGGGGEVDEAREARGAEDVRRGEAAAARRACLG